jgi:hypothetical protein
MTTEQELILMDVIQETVYINDLYDNPVRMSEFQGFRDNLLRIVSELTENAYRRGIEDGWEQCEVSNQTWETN